VRSIPRAGESVAPYKGNGPEKDKSAVIGTTMIPIRLGARPEITILELVRGV